VVIATKFGFRFDGQGRQAGLVSRPGHIGLRRCTARAARRTLYTAFGASMAIALTVSRRGWRRRHGTLRTTHATG
jgi:hypothetical protein